MFVNPVFSQTSLNTPIFVQTIFRDSNENLVTSLEITKVSYVNQTILADFLDKESSSNDPIVMIGDQKMQVIERRITLDFYSNDVITNLKFSTDSDDDDEQIVSLVKLIHDGIPVTSGDTLTQIWTFVRPL